jgi:V/A-type H+/Na+-transporting ATPase subunit A
MDRAVLIVNTSNMPVAAREASIDLGVTIAEYYRDMGYRAALMVDSLSRWAEALREISGRMGEMPGEEGYPTSLSSRLGRFYERAGRVHAVGTPAREGAVTMITAISPPGGDFSEPVTQAALRVCGALWALDPALAHQRHFPAVDWGISYSLYDETIGSWFDAHMGRDWGLTRAMLSALLQRERELRDITSLVGPEALEDADRLTMIVAEIVRDTLLRQNANNPDDAASPLDKTAALASTLQLLRDEGAAALARGVAMRDLDFQSVRRALSALRDAPRAELASRVAAAREAVQALTSRAAP